MDAKEILTKVKQLFSELTAPVVPAAAAGTPPPAPAPATDYDLKDGGKVSIDKLEVGGIVMIDGNPALPGDIELADGTKITVGDNGVISALTPGAAPAEPPTPPAGEDMGAKFTALEAATNQRFADYEGKFAAYETRFAAYETKLQKQSEMIEKLLQFGQLIVDKPAAPADPGVRKPNNFKTEPLKYNEAFFSEPN